MTRGRKAEPGDTRVSPNGYHYTRTETKWELTHRLKAEKKIGRKLEKDERVTFKDGDRRNLSYDNLIVSKKRAKSKASRKAQLEAKIEELQAELDSLEEES